VWLYTWLFVLLATPTRIRQASLAQARARAALEGAPPPCESPALPQGWRLRRNHIPSRFVTHLTAVAIVVCCATIAELLPPGIAGRSQFAAPPIALTPALDPSITIANRVLLAPAPAVSENLGQSFIINDRSIFTDYHVLVEGEQLGDLANRYNVSVASIFWSNGLADRDLLLAGDELRIPRISGMPYIVQPGETVAEIAARFRVDPQAILLFAPNGIEVAAPLIPGREIFIPGATRPFPGEVLARHGSEAGIAALTAQAMGSVRESETFLRSGPGRAYPPLAVLDAARRLRPVGRHGDWAMVDDAELGVGWVRSDLLVLPAEVFAGLPEILDVPPPPPRWVWPTYGRITSRFGWRTVPFRSFHNGLDIANRAGTPVLAARDGRVTEAGWCSGYGYCVRINHGDGLVTIYGHLLRKPPVAAGDVVVAGERIGLMGSTYDAAGGGFSTGVHLHFTVVLNGRPVDPLRFLP
jgi:murein DD-endopeptidase MepM/ murein hydrolase activator NlpD